MNFGSNFLLPIHDTACVGRFFVDRRTKSPILNTNKLDRPILSAFAFWRSNAIAMLSSTKRSTASRSYTNEVTFRSESVLEVPTSTIVEDPDALASPAV